MFKTSATSRTNKAIVVVAFGALYASGWAAARLGIRPVPAWAVAFDFAVTMPLLAAWFMRRDRKRAFVTALKVAVVGLLAARLLLPGGDRDFIAGQGVLRPVGLALLALLEAGTTIGVLRLLLRAPSSGNPECTVRTLAQARFGEGLVSRVLIAESMMWLHLLARRRPWHYDGLAHFSYHRRDASQSLLLGLIVVFAIQVPIQHALFNWISAFVAWCVTIPSIYSLLWALAHYRAVERRPISIEETRLVLRNGVLGDIVVPLDAIASIRRLQPGELFANKRAKSQLRIGVNANMLLLLHPHTELDSMLGRRPYQCVRFAIDEPGALVTALNAHLEHLRYGTTAPSRSADASHT